MSHTQTITCPKCNGSGIWYGAGRVENGVFIGKTGPCFGCRGKGKQTPADQKRNSYYWNHIYTLRA